MDFCKNLQLLQIFNEPRSGEVKNLRGFVKLIDFVEL